MIRDALDIVYFDSNSFAVNGNDAGNDYVRTILTEFYDQAKKGPVSLRLTFGHGETGKRVAMTLSTQKEST